jgi:uncharacterized OsmC-like protein
VKPATSRGTINGFNVEALEKELSAIQANPKVADFKFASSTRWKNGAVVTTTFGGLSQGGQYAARTKPHELAGDEPTPLLGTGTAVSPTGHLLHALSHSFAVAMAYYGAARGVKIDSLKIDAEGTLDLQGLLGLDPKVRPGFKQIHMTVRVDSPNPSAEVWDLFQYAQGRSPICATINQPVPVDWKVEIEATGAAPETSEVRHGVNFKDLSATLAAIQQTPVLAKCKFYSTSEWLGGAKVQSSSPFFDQAEGELMVRHQDASPKGYLGDEPTQMLGSDGGPSSEEALLQAMANCVSVTSSYHAAARGVKLESFDVNFEGDVDRRGFADADDTVNPGYRSIRGRIRVKAGGKREEIEDLMKFATTHSPMCNSVEKPVQLTYSLIHNGKGVAGPEAQ